MSWRIATKVVNTIVVDSATQAYPFTDYLPFGYVFTSLLLLRLCASLSEHYLISDDIVYEYLLWIAFACAAIASSISPRLAKRTQFEGERGSIGNKRLLSMGVLMEFVIFHSCLEASHKA